MTPRQTHASRGWSSHDEHVTVACSTCLLSASSRWPYDWTSTEIHYGHLPAAFTIKASIKTDKNVLSVLSDSHSFYKLGKRKKRVNLIEIFAWQHFWLLMFSTAIPVYAFTRAPKQKKKNNNLLVGSQQEARKRETVFFLPHVANYLSNLPPRKPPTVNPAFGVVHHLPWPGKVMLRKKKNPQCYGAW